QVDLRGRGDCLRAIEQLLCPRQVSAHLVQVRPVGERLHVAGSQLVGLSEVTVGSVGAALLHQVESQVHQKWRRGACQLQRAAEVPFPGGQIVELREQQAKEVVGLSIVRVYAQSRA